MTHFVAGEASPSLTFYRHRLLNSKITINAELLKSTVNQSRFVAVKVTVQIVLKRLNFKLCCTCFVCSFIFLVIFLYNIYSSAQLLFLCFLLNVTVVE